MEKPLLDKKLLLEKYPGKGGWTFSRITGIPQDKKGHGGTVKVRGTIDGFPISKYHLMSMGDGNLFLPVRAEIRKKIKKEAGDEVHVILYHDDEPLELPEEMRLCLQEEPEALKFFLGLSESEQKYYIQWIYSAKREETKVRRLAGTINSLLKHEKFYFRQANAD